MDISIIEWIWIAQIIIVAFPTVQYLFQNKVLDGFKPDEKKPKGFLYFNKRIYDYYVVALVWCFILLLTTLRAYCQGVEPYSFVQSAFSLITRAEKVTTDATTSVMLVLLFMFHMMRRLYECWSVSIFSYKATVSVVGLILSYGYYLCVGFTLLAESPPFTNQESCLSISSLGLCHVIGLVLFGFASYKHHRSHQILAKLRRNRAGHIVTTSYKMPRGDWFDLVSCPHYLAEILIYVSLCIFAGGIHRALWLCTAYVFTNQLFLAQNTHAWYKKKFDDYPKERRMLIPYIL